MVFNMQGVTQEIGTLEEWRIIPDFTDYAVSNYGGVKRIVVDRMNRRLKTLKSAVGRDGYIQAALCRGGKSHTKTIHRLVLNAFVGKKENLQCNHINGIKTDNRLENLEWVTMSTNLKHAFVIGLKNQKGKNHPMY